MKISNINEFKRSFEKLQWLFKTFEAQNFEDLSPMEIDFFIEIIGRLSSSINAPGTQDSDSQNETVEKSTQDDVQPEQKADTIQEKRTIVDDVSNQQKETNHSEREPEPTEKNPTTEQNSSDSNQNVTEETVNPKPEDAKDTSVEQSDRIKGKDEKSSDTPQKIVDQFRNNSPSIADRAQKNIDDSTSHLLKRGGHLSLNSLIDLNRRFLIINDVFGGKRVNFDKEIEYINQLSDLDSAIQHLNDNVVKKYNVNTTTKGFEILNKVVVRRFAS